MKKIQYSTPGFTLLELIIVMVIMVFLAISGTAASSKIIKDFRFTNTFNKIVFMVQNARNLAAAGKNDGATTIAKYGVEFNTNVSPQKINLFSIDSTPAKKILDTQNIETTTNLQFAMTTVNSQQCANGLIKFVNGSAAAELFCDGTDPSNAVSFLTITLTDTGSSRTKKFSIQQVGGIPQVQ